MPNQLPPNAISLEFERIWCARHGEPFRARWPFGAVTAATLLSQHLLHDDDFMSEARGRSDDQAGMPRAIESLLDDEAACCRVPRMVLMHAYVEAKIGNRAQCRACRSKGLGTRYKTVRRNFRHVCFECVLDRMTPMQ
jgi:hypothetical protein